MRAEEFNFVWTPTSSRVTGVAVTVFEAEEMRSFCEITNRVVQRSLRVFGNLFSAWELWGCTGRTASSRDDRSLGEQYGLGL